MVSQIISSGVLVLILLNTENKKMLLLWRSILETFTYLQNAGLAMKRKGGQS